MAAARHDPYPDLRQATPPRQLLTVSELEQLFGPDATVELRSTRPEHVEADLEVGPAAADESVDGAGARSWCSGSIAAGVRPPAQ